MTVLLGGILILGLFSTCNILESSNSINRSRVEKPIRAAEALRACDLFDPLASKYINELKVECEMADSYVVTLAERRLLSQLNSACSYMKSAVADRNILQNENSSMPGPVDFWIRGREWLDMACNWYKAGKIPSSEMTH